MARKLFISFLGTGFYRKCTYYDKNGDYTPTRFIQQATLEQVGAKEWTANDAVRIFITDDAFKYNWDKTSNSREDFKSGKEVSYTKLEQVLADMHLSCDVKPITGIPIGNNEQEMWEIFQKVYEEIKDHDELYIDLTHAFRYLPMLVLVLSNYAKFLNNISVKHLSYGNWEGRDTATNRAPIVNLLPLTMLQDWTSAAADFVKHGYAEELKDAIKNELTPLLRDNNKRTSNVVNVNKLGACLESFADERFTCRGLDISLGTAVEHLYNQLEKIEDTGIAPLNPIFEKLKNSTVVPQDIPSRCYDAAEWCFKRQLYQQAITILQEGINTFFCIRNNIAIDNESLRENVGIAFHIKFDAQSKGTKSQQSQETENKYLRSLLNDELLSRPDVVNYYTDLSGTRNDFNHAGFRKKRKPLGPSQIKNKIGKSLEFFKSILTEGQVNSINRRKPTLLINISNHPSCLWDSEQKAASKKYGKIIDKEFPYIPAEASVEDIDEMVKFVVSEILPFADNYDVTVHVMGEMTFTFELVTILKGYGIRCVASTTGRVVKELSDGKKISQFKFVKFREY